MTLSTPKRKSGLPSPASGVLSSKRKSKLQTPQSRRPSRLTNLSSSKRISSSAPIVQRSSSSSSNCTSIVLSPKRSLNECFLGEEKKSTQDASDAVRSPTRKKLHSSSLLSSTSSSTKLVSSDNEEAVKVCVRIKPLLDNEDETRAFVLGSEDNTIARNAESTENAYSFNHVYGETSSTQELYDDMVSDIVESVGDQGRNGTVFTYGQTSAGKTYTMHGILMAAGKDLFTMKEEVAISDEHGPGSKSFISIRISCMELYNEELRDLLSLSSTLSIQEDRRGNVQVTNLSERTVNTLDELMDVIQIADENRAVGATAMNEVSSRSHTIFKITFEKKEVTTAGALYDEFGEESEDKENGSIPGTKSGERNKQKVITTVSTLNLVDLAGSESVRVTGAKGERQKEGGKINQSLLTLSRVLVKLGQKDRGHINYRDSKLTRILKPSLSGNARMGCIACISPAMQYSEESKSTLDFASRTMLVKTNAKSNQKVEYDDALVQEFDKEIERLKMEVAKAEESRRQMEQSLQEAEDQIVCLRATIELEKSKTSILEMQKKDSLKQVEELKTHEKTTKKLITEISVLKALNQELEGNVVHCEAEKSMLIRQQKLDLDSFRQERKSLEEVHANEIAVLKARNQDLEAKIIECEAEKNELKEQHELFDQGHKLSEKEHAKEVADLKALNKELQENLGVCEAKRNRLREQQEEDRCLFDQERIRLEEGHSFIEEMHKMELQRKEEEALKYKESKEEMEVMYKEMQEELESNSEELQTLRASNGQGSGKLLVHLEGLENMSTGSGSDRSGQDAIIAVLKSQVAALTVTSKEGDEMATLKSRVAALTEEKLGLEWKLARERQNAQKRKDMARERRQKIKGRLSDMTGSLKEDLIQLSYEKPV